MKLFSRHPDHAVSEPYLHRNLAIYLLHRKTARAERPLLPLNEALRRGCARVHETGRVGEVEIENLVDADLYVQAGDVVKGGWQDRALGQDFIVPHSARRPRRTRVRTFCVERGRWNQRDGDPSINTFRSAEHMTASRDLKLSIRLDGSQSAVWSSVDAAQARLSRSLGTDVRAALSPTSLPLAVENPLVQRWLSHYMDTFGNLLSDNLEAVGFAFAINGQLNSADLYASPTLFCKLWSKLLEAAAVEAITEAALPGATWSTPTAPEVSAWLRKARRGRKTRHSVSPRVSVIVRENPAQVSFETMDAEQADVCIHRNVIAR